MRKIAIITSGKAEAAKRVASLFNEGNRIRVSAIVCDSPDVAEVLKAIDSSMLVLTVADIVGQKEEIAKMLADSDIEKIALENISLQHFEEEGKAVLNGAEIFIITSEEEAPREVVGAFKEEAPALPEKAHLEEKSADEEWAETLKIGFDRNIAREVPPPVPVMESMSEKKPMNPTAGQQTVRPALRPTDAPKQEPMPPTYLVWSIVMTVLCCLVPGIVAIIFSSQVSGRYYAGDIEGARRSSRNAEIWIIISFVLGVLSATLYLPIALIN